MTGAMSTPETSCISNVPRKLQSQTFMDHVDFSLLSNDYYMQGNLRHHQLPPGAMQF
jgi:hypothetical protein